MNPIAGQFSSIEQVSDQYLNQKNVNQSSKMSDISFEEVLRRQQSLSTTGSETLKFSKHATTENYQFKMVGRNRGKKKQCKYRHTANN